jgi:hypothetical protein
VIRYVYGVGDHALSEPQYGLDALSPSFNFFLSDQAHEFTCIVDGLSEAGRNLRELVQDVWAWRIDTVVKSRDLLFRGPLLQCQDTLGDSHRVAITANSYRARIARWPIPNNGPGATTTSYPMGTATPPGLGWLAINLTRPNSDLAEILTDGHVAVGSQIAQSVTSGTATDAAIDGFKALAPFDWDFLPQADGTVQFKTWAPQRGSAKPQYPLIYKERGRGNCTAATRTFDLQAFANEVWYTGQDTSGNPLYATAPTSRSYGPEGLWIGVAAPSTDTTGATQLTTSLQTQASNALAQAETPSASYVMNLEEGVWPGPSNLWLGDSPTIVIKSGRLDVHSPSRITQVQITPTDGAEKVVLSAGGQPLDATGRFTMVRTYRNIDKRIRALEWGQ